MVGVHAEFERTLTIGGTISKSGTFADVSGQVLQAYMMFREWVNEIHGGIVVNGVRHKVEFFFEDDASSPTSVKTLLSAMIDPNVTSCVDLHSPCIRTSENASWTPDMYFSGYGTPLTKAAVEITEPAGQILLAGSSSTTSIFVGKRFFFGTLTKSSRHVEDALRTLLLRGARTVAYINQDLGFTKGACKDLPEIVENFNEKLPNGAELVYGGYNDIANGEKGFMSAYPDEDEIRQQVRNLKEADPDVMVGCLYYDECVKYMNISKQENFSPMANLLTICVTSPSFSQELKETARYAIGITQFHHTMGAYGEMENMTSAQWQDWFVRENPNGDIPSYQVASHFTVGLALTKALESSYSTSPIDVALQLNRLDMDTFFGRVMFDSNGQNTADVLYVQYDEKDVQQIVMPENMGTAPLIFPQPTFEERECFQLHGPDSCLCKKEGCPPCSRAFWNFTASDCATSGRGERTIEYSWSFDPSVETLCTGGDPLPAPEMVTCSYIPRKSTLGIAIMVCSVTGCSICVGFALAVLFLKGRPIIRMGQPPFLLIITLSSAALSLTGIVKTGPHTPGSCVVEVWYSHLVYITLISGLVVKLNRVWRLIVAGKKMKRVQNDERRMLLLQAAVLVFPAAVLAIWMVVGAPQPKVQFVSLASGAEVPEYYCQTAAPDFATVLNMYRASLLLLGCYFAYSLRGVSSNLSDSRAIGAVIYNLTMLWLLSSVVTMSAPPRSASLVISFVDVLASISSVCLLLVPKFLWLDAKLTDLLSGRSSSVTPNSIPANNNNTTWVPTADKTASSLPANEEVDALRKMVASLEAELECLKRETLSKK